MKRTLILIASLSAAGCVSQAQIDARNQARAEAREAERRAAIENRCQGYGFSSGTDQFRNCVMQLDQQARAADEARRNAALQQYRQQNSGQQTAPQLKVTPIGPRSTTNCTPTYGGGMNCSTY